MVLEAVAARTPTDAHAQEFTCAFVYAADATHGDDLPALLADEHAAAGRDGVRVLDVVKVFSPIVVVGGRDARRLQPISIERE
jgi:hypothetical protein